MLHVILHQPEIPQNTGNIGRLCAFASCRLHLIHPLGFEITDRHLRRSGMDYWHSLDIHEHPDWEAFTTSPSAPRRSWLFTTHASKTVWDAEFQDGDGLLFGNEGHGAPDSLHACYGERRLVIPRMSDHPLRSLNLATSAGIAVYEALRQIHRGHGGAGS